MSKVHFDVGDKSNPKYEEYTPACSIYRGYPQGVTTVIEDVTCAKCKKTKAYREAVEKERVKPKEKPHCLGVSTCGSCDPECPAY